MKKLLTIMLALVALTAQAKTIKTKAPTLQQLSKANPYTVPADWFKTDTITIRGHFEGYDAEKFGFTSMECYYEDVFEKDAVTLVFDIAADGSFEKKFQASYPVCNRFFTRQSKVGFEEIRFFARPGETIDITVKPNEQGQYECYYHNGSSKEAERWLKSSLSMWDLAYPLHVFNGTFPAMDALADQTWQDMLNHLQEEGRNQHFTPLEMQLALADLQVNFVYGVMDFAMHHENAVRKYEPRNGGYEMVILDSVEWLGVRKPENYKALHRVDFDNPLLLTCNQYPMMLNRIQFARPVRSIQYEGLLDEDGAIDNNVETDKKVLLNGMTAYRKLMGTEGDNFLTQLCAYKNMANAFNSWRSNEASIPEILVDTTMTVAEREEVAATIQTPGRMMPIYLSVFSNPYILQKAEAFYAYKLAQTELSTPLSANNAAADLIRSLCAKYPGRYLVIDFWGMNCGPCKSAIQSSKNKRAEIAKRNDVKLIFIAGERTAEGSEDYHNYVKEWLADEETICMTYNDFGRLQELFHFNGIPHYETITPDGRRVRDDLKLDGYYNFDYELNHLKDKLK